MNMESWLSFEEKPNQQEFCMQIFSNKDDTYSFVGFAWNICEASTSCRKRSIVQGERTVFLKKQCLPWRQGTMEENFFINLLLFFSESVVW